MNSALRLSRSLAVLFLVAGLAGGAALAADVASGRVTVRGIQGHAQFARGGNQFAVLGPGMDLRPGDLIQTASKSAIELDFGDQVGTVRLTESAILRLEKIGTDTNTAGSAVIQLELRNGELLGQLKRVPAGSTFEVKVPTGLAQVVEGKFRISDPGYVVVLEGKVNFAHVPATGEPTANSVSGPPASYFAPAEGIRPAPKALVKEVTKQLGAKLPRR